MAGRLPKGWLVILTGKRGGRGGTSWRWEASAPGVGHFRGRGCRTQAEADRAAKDALRTAARERSTG